MDRYTLAKELQVGDYSVRLWKDPRTEIRGISYVTISGGWPVQSIFIANGADIDPLTGTDITGEGNPDIIIFTWAGGMYCCSSWLVYDVGSRLTQVMESPDTEYCELDEFKDIDADGRYEFITCDTTFKEAYCHRGPLAMVILKYEVDRGYIPASPLFEHLYADQMAASRALTAGELISHTQAYLSEFEQFGIKSDIPASIHPRTKCLVLAAVLPYFYSGHLEEGWREFDRLYIGEDKEAFRQDVEQKLQASDAFVRPDQLDW